MPKLTDRMLPHRVEVQRATQVSDGQGGYERQFAPVVTKLKCRLTDPRLSSVHDEAGALRADTFRTLYAEPGANVEAGDRVLVGTTFWSVQSADNQPDGVYRKAYLLAEQQA